MIQELACNYVYLHSTETKGLVKSLYRAFEGPLKAFARNIAGPLKAFYRPLKSL
jgi:hypothetical protein